MDGPPARDARRSPPGRLPAAFPAPGPHAGGPPRPSHAGDRRPQPPRPDPVLRRLGPAHAGRARGGAGRVEHRGDRGPRRRLGRRRSGASSSTGRRSATGSPCSRDWTTRCGRSGPTSGRWRRPGCATAAVGGRARPQGLEDCSGCAPGTRPGGSWRWTMRGSIRCGRRPGRSACRSPSTSPTRSRSSSRSTRRTSATRSCGRTRTGTSGRRGRAGDRRWTGSRPSTSSSTASRRSSPGTPGRRSSGRTSVARRRTSAGSTGCSPRTRTGTSTSRPGSPSSGGSRTRRRDLILRWPDRVLFGTDAPPDPAAWAGVRPLPGDARRVVPLRPGRRTRQPGSVADPRPGPAGRRAPGGLRGQRPAAHLQGDSVNAVDEPADRVLLWCVAWVRAGPAR